MHRLFTVLAFGTLLVSASCEHTGTGSDQAVNGVLNGTFSATINGAAWSATGRVVASEPAGAALILDATSPTYAMKLTMAPLAGFGSATFSLDAAPANGSLVTLTSSAGKWSTANTGGTGTISLTTLSSSRATGTFTFDAPASAGSGTTTHTVVTGKFDVTF